MGIFESIHNSLKTDYIWVNDIETFEDAKKLMEYAFNDYNIVRPHSSIEYLSPDEFERRCIIGRENICPKLGGGRS